MRVASVITGAVPACARNAILRLWEYSRIITGDDAGRVGGCHD